MKKITIQSLGREITISERTRRVSRAYNEALLEGVTASQDPSDIRIPAVNADRATEILVRELCGLTKQETDRLTDSEYDQLVKEVSGQPTFPG